MARVFVTRQLPGPALDRLTAAHDTTVWAERLPPPDGILREQAAGCDGLLTLLTDRIDGQLIASSTHLRVVSNYAVGVDNIDLDAAARSGIRIGHTPGVLTEATADLTFALLLAAARRLPAAIVAARDDWVTWDPGALLGASVHGATLGIVGAGRIGRAVARRAAGFEMRVIEACRRDDARAGLDELLAAADFVSIHCPLSDATHHLIDAESIALMKPTAILVNTARGPIIDPVALATALRDGAIAGAALDVTDPEPLPAGDPMWAAPNLLIVPHIGSATRATRERMTEIAVDNLLAGLDRRPMPHELVTSPGGGNP